MGEGSVVITGPTCHVRGCDEAPTGQVEPIYAMKADRPFERENIVVCDAALCREHAALLSWSI